jgi:hypothetical protein
VFRSFVVRWTRGSAPTPAPHVPPSGGAIKGCKFLTGSTVHPASMRARQASGTVKDTLKDMLAHPECWILQQQTTSGSDSMDLKRFTVSLRTVLSKYFPRIDLHQAVAFAQPHSHHEQNQPRLAKNAYFLTCPFAPLDLWEEGLRITLRRLRHAGSGDWLLGHKGDAAEEGSHADT